MEIRPFNINLIKKDTHDIYIPSHIQYIYTPSYMPVVNFEYIIHTVYIYINYIYTSYACAYIENMQRL